MYKLDIVAAGRCIGLGYTFVMCQLKIYLKYATALLGCGLIMYGLQYITLASC